MLYSAMEAWDGGIPAEPGTIGHASSNAKTRSRAPRVQALLGARVSCLYAWYKHCICICTCYTYTCICTCV